jgi:hypothetical protein
MEKMNQNFTEFFDALKRHGVKYLLIGGYAVAYYDRPRYTKDIDIWVERSAENSKKIMDALNDFGFGNIGLTENDLQDEHTPIIQLGYPPQRIDILLALPDLDFADAYVKRQQIKNENICIDVISLEDLISNKERVARDVDLLDVKRLKKVRERKA